MAILKYGHPVTVRPASVRHMEKEIRDGYSALVEELKLDPATVSQQNAFAMGIVMCILMMKDFVEKPDAIPRGATSLEESVEALYLAGQKLMMQKTN